MKILNTFLVIVIIALLLIPQTTTAQCHIDDWSGLKALYDNTDGDNWENRDGWDIYSRPQQSTI